MENQELERLHPALRQRRQDMIRWWSRSITRPLEPPYNALMVTESDLGNAIEATVVGLDDVARRFLIRARATLKEVFTSGVEPKFGANPAACIEHNDDAHLDRHWAIAHKTRYLIGSLLDHGDDDDLREGLARLKVLVEKTNGLSGRIVGARFNILSEFLWLAVATGDSDAALRATEPHLAIKVTPKTRVSDFKQRIAYVRTFFAVASYTHGDSAYRHAAQESLRSLLEAHRDLEHRANEVVWQGFPFAFQWAWLWERAFRSRPDPVHAIEIVRGTASLDE